jgi:hypothetical protein
MLLKFSDLFVSLTNTGLPTEAAVLRGCANTGCGGSVRIAVLPVQQGDFSDPDGFVDGVVIPFGPDSLLENLKAAFQAEAEQRNLAEVQMLESKLTEALGEVRARKAELLKS